MLISLQGRSENVTKVYELSSFFATITLHNFYATHSLHKTPKPTGWGR